MATPPLPAGYKLIDGDAPLPPLPAGYKLASDTPAPAKPALTEGTIKPEDTLLPGANKWLQDNHPKIYSAIESLLTAIPRGAEQMARGIAHPGLTPAERTSDVIEGGATGLSPALLSVPGSGQVLRTAESVATAKAAQAGTSFVADKMGASPDVSRAAGDVAGVVGGVGTQALGPKIPGAVASGAKSIMEAAASPGIPEIVGGVGETAAGAGTALAGHPVIGVGVGIDGLSKLAKGIGKRKADLAAKAETGASAVLRQKTADAIAARRAQLSPRSAPAWQSTPDTEQAPPAAVEPIRGPLPSGRVPGNATTASAESTPPAAPTPIQVGDTAEPNNAAYRNYGRQVKTRELADVLHKYGLSSEDFDRLDEAGWDTAAQAATREARDAGRIDNGYNIRKPSSDASKAAIKARLKELETPPAPAAAPSGFASWSPKAQDAAKRLADHFRQTNPGSIATPEEMQAAAEWNVRRENAIR
jgi:hypothetical protein